MNAALGRIDLANYPLLRRGKVRDVFDLGDRLLLVATDRISAFDVVLPSLVAGKGRVLTSISTFWFDRISDITATQMTHTPLQSLDCSPAELEALQGRAVIVRKAARIDIECVVRAAMAGSAWKEYQAAGAVANVPLPPGLQRGDALPYIMFTPAVKNDNGHDENIDLTTLRSIVGDERAAALEQRSREIFARGADIAAKAGFFLADTKFEYGLIDGELTVIDEVLTPDSSRYWDIKDRIPGEEPPAFDKQPVRDWLEGTGWDKQPPGPVLPDSIVTRTLERYRQVAQRLGATDMEAS